MRALRLLPDAGRPLILASALLAGLTPARELRAQREMQTTAGPVTLRAFDEAWSAGFAEMQRFAYARALPHFDTAVSTAVSDTDRYLAHTERARARSRLGQHAGARADLDAASALPAAAARRYTHARLALEVTRNQGDLVAASAAFRDLRAAAPDTRDDRIAVFLEEAALKRAWGDLSGALSSYDDVASLVAELPDLAAIAAFHRDRALCRIGLRDSEAARRLARDALSTDLRRAGTSRRRPTADWVRLGDLGVAQSLLVAAEADRVAGQATTARESFQLALQLARKLGAPRETARAHFGLVRLHLAAGEILEARLQLVAAMLLTQEGAQPDLHMETLALVGECCLREDDPAGAIGPLSLGIESVEQLRLTAPPEDRRRLLALQADHYRWLLEAYLRTGQPWEALAASEGLKARTVRDALGASADAAETLDDRVARLRQFQQRLPAGLAVVSYANADWSRSDPVAFILTSDELQVIRLPLNALGEVADLLDREAVLAAQAEDVDASRYDIGNEPTLAGLVAYFRAQIYCDHAEMNARYPALIKASRVLHYLLVRPLVPALTGYHRLLISPSGLLAYVPFDTLRDLENVPLLDRHALSLTPSLLTTLALAQRPAAAFERNFLGFGGAVYDPSQYGTDMAQAAGLKSQLAAVTGARAAQLAGNRSPYAGWARGPATNLAGTQAEVELLRDLLPNADVVIGRNVSEPHIRDLAARGELRRNRVLHFAVHGSAVPVLPELSCILLSWEGEITPAMPAERDGRLQITEFEQLPLRAELVTFSACETGLGAIVAGEGVVGLTGSLLKAGADNVLASLWPVSDYSTVYFMRRYYELHLIDGVPSDLAIAQVKRDMQANKLPGYTHPQFWAPFNLYGGRELLAPLP